MLRHRTQDAALEPHDDAPLLIPEFKRRGRNHRAGALEQSTQVGDQAVTQFFGVAPDGEAMATGIGLNQKAKGIR